MDIFASSPIAASRMFLRNHEKQYPWEIDPEQSRKDEPVLSKVRHYLNLGKTEQRLRWLLSDFSFAPINEVGCPIRDIIDGQVECLHAIV